MDIGWRWLKASRDRPTSQTQHIQQDSRSCHKHSLVSLCTIFGCWGWANQPVHQFIGGKGKAPNKERVYGLVRPNRLLSWWENVWFTIIIWSTTALITFQQSINGLDLHSFKPSWLKVCHIDVIANIRSDICFGKSSTQFIHTLHYSATINRSILLLFSDNVSPGSYSFSS